MVIQERYHTHLFSKEFESVTRDSVATLSALSKPSIHNYIDPQMDEL